MQTENRSGYPPRTTVMLRQWPKTTEHKPHAQREQCSLVSHSFSRFLRFLPEHRSNVGWTVNSCMGLEDQKEIVPKSHLIGDNCNSTACSDGRIALSHRHIRHIRTTATIPYTFLSSSPLSSLEHHPFSARPRSVPRFARTCNDDALFVVQVRLTAQLLYF